MENFKTPSQHLICCADTWLVKQSYLHCSEAERRREETDSLFDVASSPVSTKLYKVRTEQQM